MKIIFRRWFKKCKSRILRRLEKSKGTMTCDPQFSARNIHYEFSDRVGAIGCGGIGVIHKLAQQLGLVEAIDRRLHVLKIHLPYQESDHVLNIGYTTWLRRTKAHDSLP